MKIVLKAGWYTGENVPQANCEYENCSESWLCTLEKSTNGRTAGTEILMRLSEYFLELLTVFIEASRNFFLFHKTALKI
jgi:hypothetical protein